MKYPCPCCGYYTFENEPNGNYDICQVCFWEDDPMAYKFPEADSCSNFVSLVQARKNYLEFGACHKDMLIYCRAPKEDEIPQ